MSKDHISPQFIELVRKWVKVDDHIREETLRLREKKEERKELEGRILNIMKQSEQEVLIFQLHKKVEPGVYLSILMVWALLPT